MKPGAGITKINGQMNRLATTFFHPDKRKNELTLSPYKDFVKNEAGDIVQVIIKGQVGTIAFILLIMIANLINLNAATMFSRAKEVAVKKMLGSSKRQIILQFCIENGLIVFASLCLAFVLFNYLLLPQINTIVESKFGTVVPSMNHDYPLALWFIAGSLLIVIIAASYPAFHLTSLKVTDVIKGKISATNKKQYARNIFITIQFVLAITFIGVTFILSKQLNHMKSATLGFDKEDVLVMPINLAYRNEESAHARFDAMLNKLRSNPYINDISTSDVIPTAYQNNFNTFYDASSNTEISMRHAVTDAGLIPTYAIPLIEGRNFNNVPEKHEHNNVIINRTAMKALGWEHAVGRQIKSRGGDETLTVVGVMEDFHYLDLTRNVEPLLHHYGDEQQLGYTYLSVRIDPRHTNEIVTQLQNEFKAIPSRRQFSYEFMDSRIDKQYTLLNGILKVTGYVSLLTNFIAAMGLFGLVTLFTKQRVKEIGIRKVLGANVTDIIRMLSQNYAMLIIIASAIATPLVWIIMSRWLQDFAYRINVSWWTPLMAGLVALVIALSIVIFQAIKAAVANPVKSLRTE
jgi:putative ABC transport system permease protein